MMLDEQQVSQMSGFLLIPFQLLFKLGVFGRTGMILAARYYYTLLHTAVAVILYVRLRQYGAATVIAVLATYLFAPFNIMAYSYNSMGIDALEMSGVFWATANRSRRDYLISGAMLACAVLCCPYLAPLYFVFAVAGVALRKKSDLFHFRSVLWVTAGILPVAAAFFTFLFSRTDIRKMPLYWTWMKTDPEYFIYPFYKRLWDSFSEMVIPYGKLTTVIVLVLFAAVLLLCTKESVRVNRRESVFYVGCCLSLALEISLHFHSYEKNGSFYLFPLAFLGLISYVLTKDKKKIRSVFYGLFVSGIAYEIAISLTSDRCFYAVAMASVVPAFAGVLIAGNLLREMERRPAPKAVFSVLAALAMVCLIGNKATYYCENPASMDLRKQYMIQSGPMKGLYTESLNYKTSVENISEDLLYYKDKEPGTILFIAKEPWLYLQVTQHRSATYSAWITDMDTHERLKAYYETNPKKVPQYIYCLKELHTLEQDPVLKSALEHGYSKEENDVSIKLENVNHAVKLLD